MKTRIMYVLWLIAFATTITSAQTAVAYTPNAADINVWYELSERLIDRLREDNRSPETYATIINWLLSAKERIQNNERYSYILQIASDAVYDINIKAGHPEYFALLKEFRATHDKEMQTEYNQPSILTNCFAHYPLVNEYARKTNKPTPLIMAMWFMESSCRMKNPDNRDGLFQIINNDYEPGLIQRADLHNQLNDFAVFMERKWKRFYSRNPEAPRELWHFTFTLDGIQTFAALYNWVSLETGITWYPLELGKPYYLLWNSTPERKGSRDGLLLFFIKLSKMEEEYFGK